MNTSQEDRLTDVDFWLARQHQKIQLSVGGAQPPWFKHVTQLLPVNSAWTCLEIGVVPGNMLLFFASQQKYSCTGIDFSPRVNQLVEIYTAQGIRAKFIQADFLTWEPNEQFDLVYSCGFIEHFENYRQVIDKHWRLVRPGGQMLLTVPALPPVQMWSRKVFYEKAKMKEVLDSHNLEIMNLYHLQQVVEALKASEILVSTYASEMDIWFGPQSVGVRPWTKLLLVPLKFLERVVHHTGVSSHWYSPTILVLAKKTM